MGHPPPPEPPKVGILVLENDEPKAGALRQILDSEGWRVRVVPDAQAMLGELKSGEWSLIIANVALTGLSSASFLTLRELSGVRLEEGGRVRVLYVVPELAGGKFVSTLEASHLPYVVRPYHLHDFLDKVSDLLVEIKAIIDPIRLVRYEFGNVRKKKKDSARSNSMFAARDSYSYSDEDLAEYEKQESEASKNKRPRTPNNLGGKDRS